ncbi:hypothetical protein HYT23_02025 [Candidatus Pacearchaeota archaeon]|nr:hypothetical protein [Candidatus Pacearchaeota archaeon]
MDQPNALEKEVKKIKLYDEFYQENRILFNEDRQEFMFKQMRYVEEKFREWKYERRKKDG